MKDSGVTVYRCRWCGRSVWGIFGWFHDTKACFRRVRRSQTPTGRPCGCNPPVYCPTARQILARVDRGERLAGQTGEWATHTQALMELAVHLGREPSTVRAMLRHPVT